MAASAVVLWSTLSFSLFLWFSAATAEENTTSYSLSTAVYGDQNVTYNGTDSSTQPAEFESTTPTAAPSSSSTERPVQPTLSADPLPVSGQLPTPATSGKLWLYRATLLILHFNVTLMCAHSVL